MILTNFNRLFSLEMIFNPSQFPFEKYLALNTGFKDFSFEFTNIVAKNITGSLKIPQLKGDILV